MVLAMGLRPFKPESVGNVVEDIAKAGPMAVNGHPVFLSCRVIHVEDWERIVELYGLARDSLDAVFEDKESSND